MTKKLTPHELGLDVELMPKVNVWLRRGDGIAVYENQALDSAQYGHRQYVSFGSPAAQLEVLNASELPVRLPDIGSAINWKYQLVGWYRGPELGSENATFVSQPPAAGIPQFRHDCEACYFAGRLLGLDPHTLGHSFDVYWCPNELGGSVIARYGNDGPAYTSAPMKLLADYRRRGVPFPVKVLVEASALATKAKERAARIARRQRAADDQE